LHVGPLGISHLFELLKGYFTEYDAREASFGEDVPLQATAERCEVGSF